MVIAGNSDNGMSSDTDAGFLDNQCGMYVTLLLNICFIVF